MNNNDIVYVTGHQHPDTDSIASAIAYAFFKKTQGVRAVPCRLGKLNSETKYLLKRFGFEEPMFLEDARKTLAEIEIDPPLAVRHDATIQEAIDLLIKNKRRLLAVLDDDNHLCGVVTKSDLASVGFGDTAQGIASLKETPISYISKTISGTTIYDDPDTHINGKVSIIAHSESGLEKYDVKDRIVIVGNDSAAQIQLIEKGAGALIIVWAEEVQEDVVEKARQLHCPIILSGHGTMNTSRYIYFAPPVRLVMTKKSTTFFDHELVEDASKKMARTRFSSFPVVNDDNELVGYVGRYHVMNYENKKIILVDHNEFAQSVKAIEKAKVLEVLENHDISFEHLPSGIDTMSVLVSSAAIEECKGSITAEMVKAVDPDSITIMENLCLIAVVGRGMVSTEGTAARVFTALADAHINVRMIDQGSSELNIIVAVEERDYQKTIEAIYNEFVK